VLIVTVVLFQEQCGEMSRQHVERLYVFALMWSIGALLELEDRRKMESWLRGNDNIHLDLPDIPSDSEDTMFDYHVTTGGEGFMFSRQTPKTDNTHSVLFLLLWKTQ
jgi:dynein heavy chain